jgi:hypothetical protein
MGLVSRELSKGMPTGRINPNKMISLLYLGCYAFEKISGTEMFHRRQHQVALLTAKQ